MKKKYPDDKLDDPFHHHGSACEYEEPCQHFYKKCDDLSRMRRRANNDESCSSEDSYSSSEFVSIEKEIKS
jgi:hypothetical protein